MLNNCDWGCPDEERAAIRITNSKAFLVAGVGLNSWTGVMEVVGWESHDTGLAIESLSNGGFWIDRALAVCRFVVYFSIKTASFLKEFSQALCYNLQIRGRFRHPHCS